MLPVFKRTMERIEMEPKEVAQKIRNIADRIDASKNPLRYLVAQDIEEVVEEVENTKTKFIGGFNIWDEESIRDFIIDYPYANIWQDMYSNQYVIELPIKDADKELGAPKVYEADNFDPKKSGMSLIYEGSYDYGHGPDEV